MVVVTVVVTVAVERHVSMVPKEKLETVAVTVVGAAVAAVSVAVAVTEAVLVTVTVSVRVATSVLIVVAVCVAVTVTVVAEARIQEHAEDSLAGSVLGLQPWDSSVGTAICSEVAEVEEEADVEEATSRFSTAAGARL